MSVRVSEIALWLQRLVVVVNRVWWWRRVEAWTQGEERVPGAGLLLSFPPASPVPSEFPLLAALSWPAAPTWKGLLSSLVTSTTAFTASTLTMPHGMHSVSSHTPPLTVVPCGTVPE